LNRYHVQSNLLDPLENNGQMILVIGEDWDVFHARLFLCSKVNNEWQVVQNFPAVCGQNGMAWGLGVYPQNPESQPQPTKKEGDQKTPVGIFHLGTCMGYASKPLNPNLPYQPLTVTMEGVDDPLSRHYNQVVNKAKLSEGIEVDWKSYEVMRREDALYKWLMIIEHNPDNLPGAGSLIFLHIWENDKKGTAGCTAVASKNMEEILTWLDPNQNPVVVQLPRPLYHQFAAEWGLPTL